MAVVWAVGVLFVTVFTNVALSEEMPKANFDMYEYRNGSNADDDHQDLQKNMTERLEELRTNADGTEIFLTVLEKVVSKGGDTVKIPEEIDPEEHNISINDAFDRTDDFLSEQTTEAKDILSDVYQAMQNSENHTDPALLKQTRDEIMDILKSFSDAKQDVVDYRRVSSMGQMYDYYYADTALEYEDPADDGDEDDEANVPKFETTRVVDDEIDQDSDEDDEYMDEAIHDANENNFVLNVENDFNEENDEDDLKNVTKEFEATNGSDSVKQYDVTEPSTVLSPAYISENSVGEDSLFSQNQFQAKFTEDIVAIVEEDDYEDDNDVTILPRLFHRENLSKSTGGLVLEQFEAVVLEEEEDLKIADENDPWESDFIYGNDSIDLADVVPDEELYDTKVEWKDPMQESESGEDELHNMFLVGRFPAAMCIAVAIPLALFLISIIAYVACFYGSGHRRSVTIRARSLTDSDKESRICVVSICDSDTKPTQPPTCAKLPSYLEVISEKVEPVYITDLKIPL